MAPPKRRPPRKSTFIVRKEEKQRLEREIALLQAQLRVLDDQLPSVARDTPHGLPSSSSASSPSSSASASAVSSPPSAPSDPRAAVRDRHVGLMGVRALLSSYFSSPWATTLHAPIHLPRDEAARRTMLARRSAVQIRDARQLVLARCRCLELSQPHVATEWFERDDLSMALLQFDVTPFRGVRCSVRDVYDAVGFYAQNVEIYVSERLGDLTIREDDDVDGAAATAAADAREARISQRRVVSTTSYGLTIDANVVFFRQYFPAGACAEMPEEHAVVGTQAVDSDELYPYVPHERVRHDLDGACLIRRVQTSSGEWVTTIVRASVISRHSSGGVHPVPLENQAPLRQLATQWGDLMLLAVRERIYANASSTASPSPAASRSSTPSPSSQQH